MNPRKSKALKKYEGTYKKSRDYNPIEEEMVIKLDYIQPNNKLSGQALELYKTLVPGLCKINHLGAQDKILLDTLFALYQEVIVINEELTTARDDTQKAKQLLVNGTSISDDEIDKLNGRLNRTAKTLATYISLLGISPKDRPYFNVVTVPENSAGMNIIDKIIKSKEDGKK